jgi:hypothetical protein
LDVESPESFDQVLSFQRDTAKADQQLAVRFYVDEVEDSAASAAAGRAIFKAVEFCEIRVPGDRDSVVQERVRYMTPDPRDRFPAAYAKFKRGEKSQHVGTPLHTWGPMPRAQALTYAAAGIYTVEQLASLADNHAQSLPGSIADRQRARDFIAEANGQAPLAQARLEMQAMRDEIRALRDALRDQGKEAPAAVEPAAPPKRKPGRPKKIAPTEG